MWYIQLKFQLILIDGVLRFIPATWISFFFVAKVKSRCVCFPGFIILFIVVLEIM